MAALGLTIQELYIWAKNQGLEKKVITFPLMDDEMNEYGENIVSDFRLDENDNRFIILE